MKGYPGADGGSDHVPIVATLRMKLRILKQKKAGDKLETQLLRTDDQYREQYQQRMANQLNDIDVIDQQVKGYPGADGGSDHVPIVATLRMKLRILKQKKSGDKLETQLLRTDDQYREQYQQRMANQLNDIDVIDQLEDRYDRCQYFDYISTRNLA